MNLLVAEKNNISVGEMQKVETNGGFYSISRKLNQLQRLFTSNVLREWDDDFAKDIVFDISEYKQAKIERKNDLPSIRERKFP